MKALVIGALLLITPALGRADDGMTLRLLQYLAGGSKAEATATGYRLSTVHGPVMARRTSFGWILDPGGGFPGAELRDHGKGWLVTMAGSNVYYRQTANGFSAEPGQNLRPEPAGPALEPSGIEDLFNRRRQR